MSSRLDSAREELERVEEHANRDVALNAEKLERGLYEETEGDRTQDEPGPKTDRIAEVHDKLGGLAEEASDDRATRHLEAARDHVEAFLRERREQEA